jgi:predicted nucleotidyltransferase
VDDRGLEVFQVVQKAASELGLDVILVGALARQIVFDIPVHGKPYRATLDLDLVVHVHGWDQFDQLTASLQARGFTQVKDGHLRFKDGTEIDLLPFGGVEDESGNLDWDSDRVISMKGFGAATKSAEIHQVGGVSVKLVDVPGLMILKLVAFGDRHEWESKDLQDMLYLLRSATEYFGRLPYGVLGGDTLSDLDYELVGPFFLGQRLRQMASAAELKEFLRILDGVVLDGPGYRELSRTVPRALDEAIRLFEAFRDGLTNADSITP